MAWRSSGTNNESMVDNLKREYSHHSVRVVALVSIPLCACLVRSLVDYRICRFDKLCRQGNRFYCLSKEKRRDFFVRFEF